VPQGFDGGARLKFLEEDSQHDPTACGGRRHHRFEADVMRGLTDLTAPSGIVRPEVGVRELEPLPRLRGGQIENSGESRLEFVKFPGQELIRRQTLSLSGALELGNNGLSVEGEVERCEAVRWIPATAVDASAGT
jgi:hypothetical protein